MSGYEDYLSAFDFDVTSPDALLTNIRQEVLKDCDHAMEKALNQHYYLDEGKFTGAWHRACREALNTFDKRSKAFGSARDKEQVTLIAELDSRKGYFALKNTQKRKDHEEALQKEAQDLLNVYREMMKSLLQEKDPESMLPTQHNYWLTKLTTEYQEDFGDSPLFQPDLLATAISGELSKIKEEVSKTSVKNKAQDIVTSAFKIYDKHMSEVKDLADFDRTHMEAIATTENTLPYKKDLIQAIDVRRILNNAKDISYKKVATRIRETETLLQQARSSALSKYYEFAGSETPIRFPVLEAVLENKVHQGKREASNLFINEFDLISARIKDPKKVKDEMLEEIRRIVQADMNKRRSENKQLWDVYNRKLEATVAKCNDYYRVESSRLAPNDEEGRAALLKKVKKMFKDAAKPRLFEPPCISEARKKVDAFQNLNEDEDHEFEVLNRSTLVENERRFHRSGSNGYPTSFEDHLTSGR